MALWWRLVVARTLHKTTRAMAAAKTMAVATMAGLCLRLRLPPDMRSGESAAEAILVSVSPSAEEAALFLFVHVLLIEGCSDTGRRFAVHLVAL